MSVRNWHYALRNNAEGCSSPLLVYPVCQYPLLLEINEGKYLVRNTKGKTLMYLYLCSQSVCPTPYVLSVIVYLNVYYLNYA